MGTKLINQRELKRRFELEGPQATVEHLTEAIEQGHLRPHDFSVRDLAESLIVDGAEWVRGLDPRSSRVTDVLEAANVVDTSAFSNITGQIVYSAVIEAFQSEDFIADRMTTTIQTQFDGEKVPGIGKIGDQAQVVDEGMQYPTVGIGEEFIDTPSTVKRGLIVPVTKEAVFFDRTGIILERAREVGEALGISKEKRVLEVVVGDVNPYKRNGTGNNTYLSSGAYINISASNALVDWTDVETAELLLDAITDPNTGEPVIVRADTLIVPSALKRTAMRLISATEVRHGLGTAGSVAGPQTVGGNPIGNEFEVVSSRYLGLATGDATTWFLGNPRRAFWYMENFGITVVQAPANSEAEFNRDIVMQFKASERGVTAVREPRYMVKATA